MLCFKSMCGERVNWDFDSIKCNLSPSCVKTIFRQNASRRLQPWTAKLSIRTHCSLTPNGPRGTDRHLLTQNGPRETGRQVQIRKPPFPMRFLFIKSGNTTEILSSRVSKTNPRRTSPSCEVTVADSMMKRSARSAELLTSVDWYSA